MNVPDLKKSAPSGQILHMKQTGLASGAPLVFLHGLGQDLRVWDHVITNLPPENRVVSLDIRGHGQSPCPEGPYPMQQLVDDVAQSLDALQIKDCVLVGHCVSGMIAQGLAAERLDLVRALVLSNTTTKIATPEIWQARINTFKANGLGPHLGAITDQYFSRQTKRENTGLIKHFESSVLTMNLSGYLGVCDAIAHTDLYESTARLRLPTLTISGSEDGFIPADLMRETADLIPGSRFELIRKTGHMSPFEQPERFADLLLEFLKGIAHT